MEKRIVEALLGVILFVLGVLGAYLSTRNNAPSWLLPWWAQKFTQLDSLTERERDLLESGRQIAIFVPLGFAGIGLLMLKSAFE